jgi:hypothetical protein
MKTKLFCVTIISNFIINCSFCQTTTEGCTGLIFQPGPGKGKDAFIQHLLSDPAGDNTNYGDFASFEAMAWTWGEPGVLRSLIEFDLSSIPSTSIVMDARLSLYNNPTSNENNGQHSSLSGSNAALLQRITSYWGESSVTWDNQPAPSSLNEVILPQSTSPYQDYLNIDVTTIVNDMVQNPSSNYGIMFKLITEIQWRAMIFASSDHPDSTLHPKLEVCYTSPTGINSISLNEEIQINPNPSTGISSIASESHNFDFSHIEILNYAGQRIFDEPIIIVNDPFVVNLSHEAKGIYFVILSGAEHRIVKKLIIQ